MSALAFMRRAAVPVLALAVSLAAAPSRAADVVVFAAASLKNALDDIATEWQAETGNTVTIAYAGSSQLAKQIIAGAPADIFISASIDWADAVEKEGLVSEGGRADLLANTLVLIAHKGDQPVDPLTNWPDLKERLAGGKLSMALTNSVPAGQYGKAALQSLGLWDEIVPFIAESDNVRSALSFVALGEAPYGIVYETDAAVEPRVSIAARFPSGSYPPIIYPAVLLNSAADAEDRAFFDALSGEAASAIFQKYGFRMVD